MSATPSKSRLRLWRWLLGLCCVPVAACAQSQPGGGGDDMAAARQAMVEQQLVARGIEDARVLAAMGKVPRHRFVPEALADQAYLDQPLPIGHDQTISQPYIVALMTQLARPAPGDRVLEIGIGSGYQAAVLAELAADVSSIEIVTPLATRAALTLRQLGYSNFAVRSGDGYAGWPEHAPFDAIVVTAAPERIPAPLLEQLRPGGRLVIPVGPLHATQELRVVEKREDGSLHERVVAAVRFVPLTGDAAERDRGER
ncbi:protein-L-isoaspartate(D-aspartate) O-methyltransferase [Luteimonas sp. M1R5S59]|uniref:Protein-L-isoaspartate O-methyltransferase n=1 Tax=Luteimonas kalidii TaxID=3042025 RepID=A0ABT6JVJ6_9GAMM|nr:protein-L-isoaspartate(D-aspartate) O-methyltransferase [Luteimonas kalidii]MDH5834602.1 protein-L-isoaspartate(D-aspartate) O-methyltransferase [Luteimonas kalidii]